MRYNLAIPAIWILLFYLLFTLNIQAQEKPAATVSLKVSEAHLTSVFSLVEKQTGYKFAYNSDLIAHQKKVSLNVQNMPLVKLLDRIFKDKQINYTIIGNQIVLGRAPEPINITIRGYVKDSASSEALANATIYLPALKQSTSTNDYGFYSITTTETARLIMIVVHKGHKRTIVAISGRKSSTANFYLTDIINPLQPLGILRYNLADSGKTIPLVVSRTPADQIADTSNTEDDIIKYVSDSLWLYDDLLKSVSSISGNDDIMNSIQMMPGVIAGLDASNGYYVRGGNSDQNLIQLDEATLYNPSHFFGLVSTFNSSAINSATLIKDGFPATYGDNLSSVLNISMKEGNNQQVSGEVQAGSTTSGFTLHGPIVVNKSSYLVSIRRSAIDLWLRPLQDANNYNNYYFYDINAKVNYQLSANNRIYLSFYQGRDHSHYTSDSSGTIPIEYGIKYGNQTLTLRWNHLYNPQWFANTSAIYNNYFQSITASQKPYFAELYSGIRDFECKSDLNYFPNQSHKISAGASLLYQRLSPASLSDSELSTGAIKSIDPSGLPEKHSYRVALYMGDEMKIGKKWLVYVGGRLPLFYNNSTSYTNFEPRLSALFNIRQNTGIKFSYTQMHQYLHLVESYNSAFPAEIWIGSSNIIKPENSQQATLSIFKNFKSNTYQLSIEGFYKKTGNQLLFGGGEQPPVTSNIETMLIFGESESQGIELSARKTRGNLKGWIAYTLSSATQHFDSLNIGNSFPFANDRHHCLYVTASYSLNQHWELSSNLIITSGRAYTLDSETTITPGQGQGLYKKNKKNKKQGKQVVQNNYMLDPYNRLDFSITYKNRKQLANRTLESEWIFSIYNVYANPNTFFAYRTFDPVTLKPVVQQVSFISVIPSITYKLHF